MKENHIITYVCENVDINGEVCNSEWHHSGDIRTCEKCGKDFCRNCYQESAFDSAIKCRDCYLENCWGYGYDN
jgi:hypothetical protein